MHLLRRLGADLESWNTQVPGVDPELGRELRQLTKIPKASTLANGAIIQAAVSAMPPEHAFVNVGVWHGFTFLAGMLGNPDKQCVGVDKFCVRDKVGPRGRQRFRGMSRQLRLQLDDWTRQAFYARFERMRSPRHHFYEMDYADYFEYAHRGPIGVYLYDGPHRYRDQLRGLRLAEPYFANGCVVIVDDINAPDNRRATFDFIEWSANRYQVLFDRQTHGDRHPTLWNGLLVFQKLP
jgi:hypothetical protein